MQTGDKLIWQGNEQWKRQRSALSISGFFSQYHTCRPTSKKKKNKPGEELNSLKEEVAFKPTAHAHSNAKRKLLSEDDRFGCKHKETCVQPAVKNALFSFF